MTRPETIVTKSYEYQTHDRSVEKTISLRQATIERDLGRLQAWFGTGHVKSYWRLDLPLSAVHDRLMEKLEDTYLTPYIGCLDHVPMSYWECYWAAEDDVSNHYDAERNPLT